MFHFVLLSGIFLLKFLPSLHRIILKAGYYATHNAREKNKVNVFLADEQNNENQAWILTQD